MQVSDLILMMAEGSRDPDVLVPEQGLSEVCMPVLTREQCRKVDNIGDAILQDDPCQVVLVLYLNARKGCMKTKTKKLTKDSAEEVPQHRNKMRISVCAMCRRSSA